MTVILPYFITRQPGSGNGILGQLSDESGHVICDTCERPWLNNAPKVSCIPTGTYNVIKHDSPNHPDTWEITGVPGRSGILIHNGNSAMEDSEGCILVGDSQGIIDGYPAVLNSVATLEMLRNTLPDNFILTIKNA